MNAPARLHAQVRARIGDLTLDVELVTAEGPLVLVGPNGAGKTSLLLALLGVLPSDRAHVSIGELVLADTHRHLDIPVEARRIAYVPQDYGLFPHWNARDNVAFALASALGGRMSRHHARADAVLQDIGISALAERRPGTLSGGEKQRLALARALAVEPRALLLDEPLAALDVHARRDVRRLLARTLHDLAIPSVWVTHDPADARTLASSIVVLEAGKVTQAGSWDTLVRCPATPFVQGFVATDADG